jgi:hypothetical protein
MEFGNYNNYKTWPFQVLGVSCALVVFATVFAGMAYSKLFNAFMKTPEGEEQDPDWIDVSLEVNDVHKAAGDYVNMEKLEENEVAPVSNDYVDAEVADGVQNNNQIKDDTQMLA